MTPRSGRYQPARKLPLKQMHAVFLPFVFSACFRFERRAAAFSVVASPAIAGGIEAAPRLPTRCDRGLLFEDSRAQTQAQRNGHGSAG